MAKQSSTRLLILVRHGSRQVRWDREESKHDLIGWPLEWPQGSPNLPFTRSSESDFKHTGVHRTVALAGRLADELKKANVQVLRVSSSVHRAAMETAWLVSGVLNERGVRRFSNVETQVEECDYLRPEALTPSEKDLHKDLKDNLPQDQRVAWVLVGHQPRLTEIAKIVVRNIPGKILPLGGSEIACIDVDQKRLLWLLTERSDALLRDLKEKVKSKIDVAKFFLGTLVVNTGLILNQEIFKEGSPRDVILVVIGVFLLLIALSLTAATLFAYDRLLMPLDFWGGSRRGRLTQEVWSLPPRWSVVRPPSQAHLVLYYEMIHVWDSFFVPAISFSFAAIALFIIRLSSRLNIVGIPGALATACVLAFATGWLAYELGKPDLGTTD